MLSPQRWWYYPHSGPLNTAEENATEQYFTNYITSYNIYSAEYTDKQNKYAL